MKVNSIGVLLLTLSFAALAQPLDRRPSSASAILGTNKVTITVTGGERLIVANGIPDHSTGQFPGRGNPNRISTQTYNFHIPANPKTNSSPTSSRGAWFGVALNGIPFEPGTAEFWNGQPEWVMEAKSGFIDLGLDQNNAHVQPNGSYHYHGLPSGLIAKLGGDGKRMLLVGWAADGFPIYTSYAHSTANDAKSPLKKMRSSWQLKKSERNGGPGGNPDGKYTADYEFVKGSGDLDECNGRFGFTPEFPQGTYYYCITEEFPQLGRFWRGTADASFSKRAAPGNRGPNSRGPGGFNRGPRRPREGNPPEWTARRGERHCRFKIEAAKGLTAKAAKHVVSVGKPQQAQPANQHHLAEQGIAVNEKRTQTTNDRRFDQITN